MSTGIRAAIALTMVLASPVWSAEPGPDALTKAKRVLILGDSITYGGGYVVDFECWVATRPGPKPEIINMGLPSETVSGLSEDGHAGGKFPRPDLHERLGRALPALKPDLILACYGMNDGIYQPLDEARFKAFRDGTTRLREAAAKAGAGIIHLTPPVYDAVPVKGRNDFYDGVLAKYAEWLLEQRKTAGWSVIDIHGPMSQRIAEERKANPAFTFAGDGVHPNAAGHRVMAEPLVAFFGGAEAVAPWKARLETPEGKALRKLVEQRMAVRRDAWLAAVGHKRPGIGKGLPVEEAGKKADELTKQIEEKSQIQYPKSQ
jgi:lysophospholipase L1-like esterase